MSWQPILEGALKDRAQETIGAILEALSTREGGLDGPSLAGGIAGEAILHAYVAQTEHGQDHAALAVRCLLRATAAVAGEAGVPSLYRGLTGVGWALAHFQGRLPGLEGQDELAEIDEVLQEHLGQSPWPETYDLIDGLVGFGVYALERGIERRRDAAAGFSVETGSSGGSAAESVPLSRVAAGCLERVIERLAETAERRPDGTTWVSCQEWVPPKYRDRYPRRYYNLGLAHGVPGVVALLGRACAAGVATARPLLKGTVRWLLAQQAPGGFPSRIALEKADEPARLAWCYGDPGVAAALLWTARLMDEAAWEREALAIARRAAERPAEQSGVVDAGLCHGAAGLGHLFNRIFQATGDGCLGEAARSWFLRTLQMRRPGRGVGGYETWGPSVDEELTWLADPSLLTGAAGIALALAAATGDVEPAWDRVLLTAVPPRE